MIHLEWGKNLNRNSLLLQTWYSRPLCVIWYCIRGFSQAHKNIISWVMILQVGSISNKPTVCLFWLHSMGLMLIWKRRFRFLQGLDYGGPACSPTRRELWCYCPLLSLSSLPLLISMCSQLFAYFCEFPSLGPLKWPLLWVCEMCFLITPSPPLSLSPSLFLLPRCLSVSRRTNWWRVLLSAEGRHENEGTWVLLLWDVRLISSTLLHRTIKHTIPFTCNCLQQICHIGLRWMRSL